MNIEKIVKCEGNCVPIFFIFGCFLLFLHKLLFMMIVIHTVCRETSPWEENLDRFKYTRDI